MEERVRFVERFLEHDTSMSRLCAEFGISRKTGYKMVARFKEGGKPALEDWPRKPHVSPMRTAARVESRLVELRGRHPHWGPKKLRKLLEKEGEAAPALSTVALILKRHGLVREQRPRRRADGSWPGLVRAQGPNELWCVDFKGWFRTANGVRCDPLTVMDAWSRYLICCEGLFGCTKTRPVQEVFERLFEQYGLPRAILSDNGSPWASTGAGGLTQLSAWWIRLGIMPFRIFPGRPQQNGRLERLHRTLKQETARPSAVTPLAQQERFDAWRVQYNEVRPHEALGLEVPRAFYEPSVERYRGLPPTFDYPDHMVVRRVYKGGQISWHDRSYPVSLALAGQDVGLALDEDSPHDRATVYLGDYVVGVLDFQAARTLPARRSVGLVRVGAPTRTRPPGGLASGALEDLPVRLSVLPMCLE